MKGKRTSKSKAKPKAVARAKERSQAVKARAESLAQPDAGGGGSGKAKKKHAARQARDDLAAQSREKVQAQDPFSKQNVRKLGLRLGIPLVIGWIVVLLIPGWIPKAIAGVVTLIIAGIVLYVVRFSRKSKAVADLIRSADSEEGRQDALEKLDRDYKQGDTAATFAKAQLQLQTDPRAALETLEAIRLEKVMATVADEARCQRAMIHLMLGEIDQARVLVDQVDLSKHKEPKTRATLAAIVGEAWARSGAARKAIEMLETFELGDETYVDVLPQLLRSLAFAYAWSNQTKLMRSTVRRLGAINVQMLMGFITKKKNPMGVSPRGVHPALEKEAMSLVTRSSAVPRKMQIKRM